MTSQNRRPTMKDNQAKYPQLRFKGFTDPWEQRKFSNLVKKVGKHPSVPGDYTAYSVSNVDGLIPQTQQFDGSRLDVLDKSAYKVVNPGEFAYNPARINVGSVAYNDLEFPVLVSSLYVVVRMDQAIDDEFILQFIRSPQFLKEVRRNTEGSVREYLFFDNFKNVRFPFALNIEEQQKVGSFLRTMDDTIALHQRKLAKLKELKQGYLQKLFPKNGSKFPQLRFAGFADDWEERKLGDVVGEIQSGNRLPKDSLTNGDVPYVVAQTKNDGVFTKIARGTLDYNGKPMKLFPGNSISFSIDNPEAMFYRNAEFYTSNIMRVIHEDHLTHEQYVFILENMKRFIRGYDWSRKFSGPVVSNLEYLQPSEEEQQKIGSFFKQLDDTIALHQRKLDLLKEQKNGFLQKMFV